MRRDPDIDAWRGLAILLMLLDHFALVMLEHFGGGIGWHVIRLTLTRPAMPIFFVTLGWLLIEHRPSADRIVRTSCLAALCTVLWLALGQHQGDILWGVVVVLLLRRWVVDVPWLVLGVGLIQSAYWPGLNFAGGYEIGRLFAFASLGPLLHAWLAGFPISFRPGIQRHLGVVGQHPLSWYVGHLIVLTLLSQFGGVR